MASGNSSRRTSTVRPVGCEQQSLVRVSSPLRYGTTRIPDGVHAALDLPAPVPAPVSRSRRRAQLLRALLSTGTSHFGGGLDRSPPASPQVLEPYACSSIFAYSKKNVVEEIALGVDALRSLWLKACQENGGGIWMTLSSSSSDVDAFLTEEVGLPMRMVLDARAGVGRAKVEVYEKCIVLAAHVAGVEDGEVVCREVMIAMIPDMRTVVTLGGGETWRAGVADVLRADVCGVRGRHVTHLVVAMLDGMLESYFTTLECVGDMLDEVEWAVLHDGDGSAGHEKLRGREVVRIITRTKRELGSLRRRVWPLREVLTKLTVVDDGLVAADARGRMREGLDRVMQVLDVVECYRDVGHSLLDLHLAAQNNRMQEIMQTLAVVTTIFVPLTFLAGIEGMNFKNQPELYGDWSYFAFWAVVCLVLAGQIAFFRMKGWL